VRIKPWQPPQLPVSPSLPPHRRYTSPTNRRITPQAGRALEHLAHAIEYLTDEFVHTDLTYSAKSEQLQAVKLLMALNRQVYFECPEVPSFSERCRALVYLLAA
jgi:hypothetical protein